MLVMLEFIFEYLCNAGCSCPANVQCDKYALQIVSMMIFCVCLSHRNPS